MSQGGNWVQNLRSQGHGGPLVLRGVRRETLLGRQIRASGTAWPSLDSKVPSDSWTSCD